MGKVSIPVFDPLGILEKVTRDAPVGLYDPVGGAIRDTLKGIGGGHSRFIGGCKVSNGLCLTHGYSVSKTVKCPKSELTDEEWSTVWELAEEAFPHGQDNPWVDRWWPATMAEVEETVSRYATSLREAARKYALRAREAAARYSESAEKAIYHYRTYCLSEYYKGR